MRLGQPPPPRRDDDGSLSTNLDLHYTIMIMIIILELNGKRIVKFALILPVLSCPNERLTSSKFINRNLHALWICLLVHCFSGGGRGSNFNLPAWKTMKGLNHYGYRRRRQQNHVARARQPVMICNGLTSDRPSHTWACHTRSYIRSIGVERVQWKLKYCWFSRDKIQLDQKCFGRRMVSIFFLVSPLEHSFSNSIFRLEIRFFSLRIHFVSFRVWFSALESAYLASEFDLQVF